MTGPSGTSLAPSTSKNSRTPFTRTCIVIPRRQTDEDARLAAGAIGIQQASMAEANANEFPIVDPHQHFWDLSRNYYPWLCDPKPMHFRYGDYSSLKRNYLPAD